jgi:hypothetical protein
MSGIVDANHEVRDVVEPGRDVEIGSVKGGLQIDRGRQRVIPDCRADEGRLRSSRTCEPKLALVVSQESSSSVAPYAPTVTLLEAITVPLVGSRNVNTNDSSISAAYACALKATVAPRAATAGGAGLQAIIVSRTPVRGPRNSSGSADPSASPVNPRASLWAMAYAPSGFLIAARMAAAPVASVAIPLAATWSATAPVT